MNAIRTLPRKEWPPLLSEIPDPPNQLYVCGTLPSFELKWLSVVGSRNATAYGAAVVRKLIGGLRGYPIAIVSGLALGIDGLAHEAALSAGLPTVSIPGSGLSNNAIYPRSHLSLSRTIIANGGALLSEFDPDFRATKWSFPKRNRIMAGVSHGVLLIEARVKSGTLITARLGMEYNREVMAVPGPIDSAMSSGTNELIKVGATPITCAEDILHALSLRLAEQRAVPSLPPEEAEVINLLTEPMTRDDLIRSLSRPPSESMALISKMELNGLVIEVGGILHASIQ